MNCNPFRENQSPAIKRYTAGVLLTMSGYVLAVLGTSTFVHHHPPHGAAVYLLAALPSLCIFAMLGVVIIYLRDEKDEYVRLLAIRSLLVATFAVLAVGAYTDLLRSFGNLPALPPFTEFVSFWVVFGMAQAVQSARSTPDE